MKFNVEVAIDWLDEGCQLDNELQGMVVAKVAAEVTKNLPKQIMDKVVQEIDSRVMAMTDQLWSDFVEKRVTLTDKFGDPVEHHESVKEMLKSRLDNFLNERVDTSGKVLPKSGACAYNAKPRIEWVLDQRIAAHTKDFVAQVQKDFDDRLKAALTEKLKTSVSQSMLKNIDLGSLVAK